MENLMKVLDALIILDIPACDWDPEESGDSRSGHWTGTKMRMEEALGRALTPEEITLLSLTRFFGPTPCVSDAEARRIGRALFPNGNNGWFVEWWELRFLFRSGHTAPSQAYRPHMWGPLRKRVARALCNPQPRRARQCRRSEAV